MENRYNPKVTINDLFDLCSEYIDYTDDKSIEDIYNKCSSYLLGNATDKTKQDLINIFNT